MIWFHDPDGKIVVYCQYDQGIWDLNLGQPGEPEASFNFILNRQQKSPRYIVPERHEPRHHETLPTQDFHSF